MLTNKTAESPAQRRRSKTRQEILEVAHTIIKEQGMEALTMRTLADKMDYTPAALYKYFHGKEDILEGLRREGWTLFRSMQAQAAQKPLAPPELLQALGQAYQNFASQYPEYYLLMFDSIETAPRSFAELMTNPDLKRVTDLIQDAIDRGYFKLPPGVTALHVRLLIWFTSHGMAMLKLTQMRECQPEFEAVSREAAAAFIQLIVKRP